LYNKEKYFQYAEGYSQKCKILYKLLLQLMQNLTPIEVLTQRE